MGSRSTGRGLTGVSGNNRPQMEFPDYMREDFVSRSTGPRPSFADTMGTIPTAKTAFPQPQNYMTSPESQPGTFDPNGTYSGAQYQQHMQNMNGMQTAMRDMARRSDPSMQQPVQNTFQQNGGIDAYALMNPGMKRAPRKW